MSLLHALVASKSTILAEHSTAGNEAYTAAIGTILDKIPVGDSKLTYAADSILIHYQSKDGLVALVIAEDAAGRRMPFGFLDDLLRRFTAAYGKAEIEDAPAYGMAGFSGDIAKLMKQFMESPPSDPIRVAQAELDSVKSIMVKNLDQVLSRGERIELLVNKTDAMSTQARAFRKRSAVIRRKMWWKNIKVMCLIGFSITLLAYLLVASICGAGLNLDAAIGFESPTLPVAWLQRDILLYAVGIGAKRDELKTLYELDPNWQPFPTYPLVLTFKGDSPELNNFGEMQKASGRPQGLPVLDPTKTVHAEQSIHIIHPIPAVSGPGWTLKKTCVGVKDTGKGLIIDGSQELVDPKGVVYARMVSSAYAFGKYGVEGQPLFSKSVAPPQPTKALGKPPARVADLVMSEKTTEEQAVIYRLSGDYNPLHIFPGIGLKLGFKGAILHGLGSYGHAARAIMLKVADGDNARMVYMSARFTTPVMPGDELETSMWLSQEKGLTRVDFIQKIVATGKVCLGGGVALIGPKSGATKL